MSQPIRILAPASDIQWQIPIKGALSAFQTRPLPPPSFLIHLSTSESCGTQGRGAHLVLLSPSLPLALSLSPAKEGHILSAASTGVTPKCRQPPKQGSPPQGTTHLPITRAPSSLRGVLPNY
ncbi:hypothetical protein FKM82_029375 [Ascaphus truei]